MIVRLNQIEPQQFEADPAWPAGDPTGRITIDWQPRGFEVLILDQDEQNRPVPAAFRQQQLRRVIPLALAALAEQGQTIVLRLDGPVAIGELLPTMSYLAADDTLFACSEFQKLQPNATVTSASLRIAAPMPILTAICNDENVGLSRSVRLRALAVPANFVAPLLDISATDDERWQEIVPLSPFLLSTTPQLRSLRILSASLDPLDIKSRLTRQLTEVARTAAARA